MSVIKSGTLLCLILASNQVMQAQIGPFPSASVLVEPASSQAVALSKGSKPILTDIVVDTVASGGDSIHAYVADPGVVISLMTPAGVEITATNASSLGFMFSTYTAGSSSALDIPSLFTAPGQHTLIEFPAGQSSGTYRIKANTSAAAGDTGMFVTYSSPSSVRAGAVTDSTSYRKGDFVILSALVFDRNNAIRNAKVTAVAGTLLPLDGSIVNYQLAGKQTDPAGFTTYTYTAQLINRGADATNVTAEATSSDGNTEVTGSILTFGHIGAGATVKSLNAFSVQLRSTATFDPSVLHWTISAPATPIQITLLDSGTYDAAPGDGVYTSVFTPPAAGSYSVLETVTGTSIAGIPFMRTASTTFEVENPMARLVGFSDAPVRSASGTTIDHVAVTANVSVQAAGNYRLTLDLVANNGHRAQAYAAGSLRVGTQRLELKFPAATLAELGADGPYTEANARLIFEASSGDKLADLEVNLGSTQAYTIASLRQGYFYFTGRDSSNPVDANGTSGFEILNIRVGIPQQSGGACQGYASLYAGTKLLDSASRYGTGTDSVTFSFNGYRFDARASTVLILWAG